MKSALRFMALGLLLLLPFSAAFAAAPTLTAISDVTLNALTTASLNVVAADLQGRPITLTSSLPAFAHLNTPTTGTGVVTTTLGLNPSSSEVGTFTGSVTATAGGEATTKTFQITVNAAGSDLPPVVGAPQYVTGTVGTAIMIYVTASDATAISSFTATGLPSGATFTAGAGNTTGTLMWTPASNQAGEYDVVFTASNALSGSNATHIHVTGGTGGTLTLAPIGNVSVAEGSTANVSLNATAGASDAITLTSSLPSFATLNSPTTGTGSVETSIHLAPGAGTAGTYAASVTATSGTQTSVRTFVITVTSSGGGGTLTLAPIGNVSVAEGSTANVSLNATAGASDAITLTSSLPSFATLNSPTTGTGSVQTSVHLAPGAGTAGTYAASVTATSGSQTATRNFVITVTSAGGGGELTLAPIGNVTVAEGSTANRNVNATAGASATITLTSSLPSFATLNSPTTGTGSVQTSIHLAPGAGTAGTYAASVTATSGSQTATRNFTITVTSSGGGGGGGSATFTLIGHFRSDKDRTCFRIRSNNAFDLNAVVLSSIRLNILGHSLAATSAKLQTDCEEGDGDRGDDDARRLNLGGGDGEHHGDDGDDNDDDCDCGDHDGCGDHGDCDDNDCDDCGGGGGTCTAVGIRACFSTRDLIALGGSLPGDLANATITGDLSGGGTFSAAFSTQNVTKKDDHGKGKRLNPKARPNPLNPNTKLTFTLSQPGRVRVNVYDMQGRLVSKLLDEYRAAGEQTLVWDGSNARNGKVASGVYFFRINAADGEAIQRVAVVK